MASTALASKSVLTSVSIDQIAVRTRLDAFLKLNDIVPIINVCKESMGHVSVINKTLHFQVRKMSIQVTEVIYAAVFNLPLDGEIPTYRQTDIPKKYLSPTAFIPTKGFKISGIVHKELKQLCQVINPKLFGSTKDSIITITNLGYIVHALEKGPVNFAKISFDRFLKNILAKKFQFCVFQFTRLGEYFRVMNSVELAGMYANATNATPYQSHIVATSSSSSTSKSKSKTPSRSRSCSPMQSHHTTPISVHTSGHSQGGPSSPTHSVRPVSPAITTRPASPVTISPVAPVVTTSTTVSVPPQVAATVSVPSTSAPVLKDEFDVIEDSLRTLKAHLVEKEKKLQENIRMRISVATLLIQFKRKDIRTQELLKIKDDEILELKKKLEAAVLEEKRIRAENEDLKKKIEVSVVQVQNFQKRNEEISEAATKHKVELINEQMLKIAAEVRDGCQTSAKPYVKVDPIKWKASHEALAMKFISEYIEPTTSARSELTERILELEVRLQKYEDKLTQTRASTKSDSIQSGVEALQEENDRLKKRIEELEAERPARKKKGRVTSPPSPRPLKKASPHCQQEL